MSPEEKEKINDIIMWLQYMYTWIYSTTIVETCFTHIGEHI